MQTKQGECLTKINQDVYNTKRQRHYIDDYNICYSRAAQMEPELRQIMPMTAQSAKIRKMLLDIGTDLDVCDQDPYGDGDQSEILDADLRDKAREIYYLLGDSVQLYETCSLNFFAMSCIDGDVETVQKAILDIRSTIPKGIYFRNDSMKIFLDMRESAMRFSPLLMLVTVGKIHGDGEKHVKIASILLKYGACPRAKDVLGKTVCHYGAGLCPTPSTLKIVDMCIQAAQTSYLYDRDVELCNLKTSEMNGLKGVVGGFDTKTGRRCVYLIEKDKEVWVKPSNIRLLVPDDAPEKTEMLADIKDRLGSVALHEIIYANQHDAADLLLNQHKCSIHIQDLEKRSPLSEAMYTYQVCPLYIVSGMVLTVSRKQSEENRIKRKQSEKLCSTCGNPGRLKCSGCRSVIYCGSSCQREHWKKGHKDDCVVFAKRMAGIKVFPDLTEESPNCLCCRVSYHKPHGIDYDDKFVVKVQAIDDSTPLIIHDETRRCQFFIKPGQTGFQELLSETRMEMAYCGHLTFMKASFDDSETCTIYPATSGIKSEYTW